MRVLRLFVVIAILFPSIACAVGPGASDSVKVLFRLGYRHYEPGFSGNAARMHAFMRSLHRADSMNNIDHIIIKASASPDGTDRANERLTVNRCRALTDYIAVNGHVDPSHIESAPIGIGWDELRRMVAMRDDVPEKEAVLRIIDETPVLVTDGNGKITGGRKKSLMELAGGRPYRWMYDNLFGQLRSGLGITLYVSDLDADRAEVARLDALRNGGAGAKGSADAKGTDAGDVYDAQNVNKQLITPPLQSSSDVRNTDAGEIPAQESAQSGEAPRRDGSGADAQEGTHAAVGNADMAEEPLHRFALKTNLLYYAILMPSLELEWRINDRWSANLEADVAWWSRKSKHKYYQLAVISPEVRRWFRTRKPWHGMYAGAFAGFTWYDLENGRRGHRGEGGAVGLSWGYMWSISRNWSMEAGIGVGYLYTRYKEYIPYDGHYIYQRTKSTSYFGPLKARLAIVWRFDDLNRKGGRK